MTTTPGENCEEHGESIVELRTTFSNGRWAVGVISAIAVLVLSFAGWVANDNLSAIRTKSDRIEGLIMTYQRESDRLKFEVDSLKEWKKEIDEHIKTGRR